MNRGLAVSAETMRLPSLRATSLSGGNCSLLLHHRRLRAGGRAAVLPRAAVHDAAEIRHIVLAQHIGDTDQHLGFTSVPVSVSHTDRPGAMNTKGVLLR